MNTINTTADLMDALAEALDQKDLEMVEAIDRQTRDWLEGSRESSARVNLIEAVRAAIYEMEQ